MRCRPWASGYERLDVLQTRCAPLPLVGRGWGWGSVLEHAPCATTTTPSPSRLRACPLPAIIRVTKPRQAGGWLGREQTESAARLFLKAREQTASAARTVIQGKPPSVKA